MRLRVNEIEVLKGLCDRLLDEHYPNDELQWFGLQLRKIVGRLRADTEPRRFCGDLGELEEEDAAELAAWRGEKRRGR